MQAMLALAMGTALVGIDVGWQPLPEGGLEYIVQIEPETLARLKPGDELATGIRPMLRDVRRYRIVVGKGPLPRIALPEKPAVSPGTNVPRAVPPQLPLAATEPHRSVVVPAERAPANSAPTPLAAAPRAAVPTPISPPTEPRVAAVPRPPASVPPAAPPTGRVMPSFDALPNAATKPAPAPTPIVKAPYRGWQAPAATTPAAKAAPIAVPAPATLPLKAAEESTTPPLKINAPPVLPVPAINVGDRYRDDDRYRDRAPEPAAAPNATPLLPSTERKDDRYRDYSPPPAQSKAAPTWPPVEAKSNSTDKSASADKRSAEKAPTTELAGPLLPVPTVEKPKTAKASPEPPSFDLPRENAPKSLSSAESSFPANSRLAGDTFDQKPAPLVQDPAVKPASVEPLPAMTPAASKAATSTPTDPSSTSGGTTPPRPWMALTLSLFALFASLGGNLFLGWVAHDARSRYGLLLRESRAFGSP